jgi:hypothetical protein
LQFTIQRIQTIGLSRAAIGVQPRGRGDRLGTEMSAYGAKRTSLMTGDEARRIAANIATATEQTA